MRGKTQMSKTIIPGDAHGIGSLRPVAAHRSDGPAAGQREDSPLSRPPGRWYQSLDRGTGGHERNDRHDRSGRYAARNDGQTAPPTLPPQMMQAIVQARYGSADVLL
jgi:hypothetical protein